MKSIIKLSLFALVSIQLAAPVEASPSGNRSPNASQQQRVQKLKASMPKGAKTYTTTTGKLSISYYFAVGKKSKKLLAFPATGTTLAQIKAARKHKSVRKDMKRNHEIEEKKIKRKQRAKAGARKLAEVSPMVQFTSDEVSDAGSAADNQADPDMDELDRDAEQMKSAWEGDDPDAYGDALDKEVQALDKAQDDLIAAGDTEGAAALQQYEDELLAEPEEIDEGDDLAVEITDQDDASAPDDEPDEAE